MLAAIIEQHGKQEKSFVAKQQRVKKDTIASYKKRLIELEETLPKIENIKLYKKMEKERAELDEKVDQLKAKLENIQSRETRKEAIFKKSLLLLEHPMELR